MKKFRSVLCLLLCLAVMLPASTKTQAVSLKDITSDSIKEKENQISTAQDEKKALQSNLSDVKKIKQQLQNARNDLSTYVTQLDEQLMAMQQHIAELENQIEVKSKEIVLTQAELDEAVEIETAQYEAMKKRIKFMYEKGDDYYLDLLFSAQSFADMLNKADYIERLSAYDRQMLDQYVAVTQYVELCKQQLEIEKEVLEQSKLDVETEEAAMEELIAEKEIQINHYNADITEQEKAIREYEEDIAAQNQIIKDLEAAVAAERQAIYDAQHPKITYDGGVFAWPAPSFVRISDDYGQRIHPILKKPQFHNGVDMAAPGGSPILAAYSGEVVAASYNSSMGNYIMIDHGDKLYTIYMHASALYVKKGDIVARGQQIAAVGTTGRSTGNHLHFSVRLNGEYVSPWNYLSK